METIGAGRTEELERDIEARLAKRAETEARLAAGTAAKEPAVAVAAEPTVAPPPNIPQPPFFGDRVVSDVPIDTIAGYVNTVALYRGQWGFKRGQMADSEYEAAGQRGGRAHLRRLLKASAATRTSCIRRSSTATIPSAAMAMT
jgi:5-methyltetrahydrofolate--homocysteine methyltransferase